MKLWYSDGTAGQSASVPRPGDWPLVKCLGAIVDARTVHVRAQHILRSADAVHTAIIAQEARHEIEGDSHAW